MASSSAEGALALLTEEDDALKVYALQRINATVHENWHQASSAVATVEALFEDEDFSHRELAALVASKVRTAWGKGWARAGPCCPAPLPGGACARAGRAGDP